MNNGGVTMTECWLVGNKRPVNPLIQQTATATLTSIINTQAAYGGMITQQIALAKNLCNRFGDQYPEVYTLLQQLEGGHEVVTVLNNASIGVLAQHNREING